jgi:hypothetical protein
MAKPKRKRSPKSQMLLPPSKPSPFVVRLMGRLLVFNLASAMLQALAVLYLAANIDTFQRIWGALSQPVRTTLVCLLVVSVAYRVYLNLTDNRRIKVIALDDRQSRAYAVRQVASTLMSMLFMTTVLLFVSGLLEQPANWISSHWSSLDPTTVAAILATCISILWNVVSSAIWDLIKWLFKSAHL